MATHTLFMPYGQYPASYLPKSDATDYNPSLGELLTNGSYSARTATQAVFRQTNGVELQINGTDLAYASSGTLNGGTITSVSLIDISARGVIQTITGLNVSGASFFTAVTSGNAFNTAALLLGGNDTIQGSEGSDELRGYAGNDVMIGGGGADNFIGGRGADTYDGNTTSNGLDQLSYEDTYSDSAGATGVLVDMATGTATDPWGNAETFVNIQRIKGSQFADTMYGSANNDQFRPLGGDDVIDGRGGTDTIRYDRDAQYNGTKGVSVNLATGVATDGFGNTDKLISIENVVGTAFGDILIGSDADNVLDGGDGADSLSGGGGKDTLSGGAGVNTLNGGAGVDKAVFDSARDAYTITRAGAGNATVTAKNGVSTDTLIDVERLQFKDGTLAFDAEGIAGQAYRLYQAAFARTPDKGGLGFWINQLDADKGDLIWAARNFIDSAEFKSTYGTTQTVTNTAFVGLVYQNVLHRQPDAAGFSFWESKLGSGYLRENLLADFSESAENKANVATAISDGIWFG